MYYKYNFKEKNMNIDTMAKALHNYKFTNEITSIEKYGYGRINKTWLIETSKEKFILQRINSDLYTNIPKLMNNIILITNHLKTKNSKDPRNVLSIVYNNQNEPFTKIDNDYYRIYKYIDNSVCYQTTKNYDLIKKLGSAFGNFQKDLSDFDQNLLFVTIPNFHNTAQRYNDFKNSLRIANTSAITRNKVLILKFIKKKKYANLIQELIDNNQLPKRVTHNDTKLNNVIFDKITNSPLAILDLDTVMPGTLLHDFGDAVRYCCNTSDEEETDLSKIKFDINLYKAFCEGYLSNMTLLTEAEIKHLAYSPLVMAYELGLRFLTDYMNGNKYFSVSYECQNYKRAQNQLKLLEDMENNLTQMKDIISNIILSNKKKTDLNSNDNLHYEKMTDKYFSDISN